MHPDLHRLLKATRHMPSNLLPGFGASSNSSSPCTPVETFKRRINRDYSQFTNFQDGKCWDAWNRNTLVTDRAQDASEVLSTECMPLTPDGISLFSEKKKFMCSVLATTFQTERGKKHAREHEQKFNNQIVCSKLETFCIKSTGARVNESYILSCMTSAKTDSWKDTN